MSALNQTESVPPVGAVPWRNTPKQQLTGSDLYQAVHQEPVAATGQQIAHELIPNV